MHSVCFQRCNPAIKLRSTYVTHSKNPLKPSTLRGSVVGRLQNRRQVVVVKSMDAAAGAGGMTAGDEDPYKVLEVIATTPSERVMASYNKLIRQAKADGAAKLLSEEQLKSRLAQIEAAYNSILMNQMRARLSGASTPSDGPDLKYADRRTWVQEYAPWAPKWCPEEKRDLLINAAVLAGLWAYALLSLDPQVGPMVTGMCVFFMRTFFKLHRVDPSPDNKENPDKAKADNAKFARAAGLTLGPIAVGIIFATFVPNFLAYLLKMALPAWVLIKQEVIVDIFTTTLMAIASSFYR